MSAEKYGCYYDLDYGEDPSLCVADGPEYNNNDCYLVDQGKDKTNCGYWRAISKKTAEAPCDCDCSRKLEWTDYDKSKVPLNELLLFETTNGSEKEYYSGMFHKTNNGSCFGVIGGHFYFDHKVLRYASIQHLLPGSKLSEDTK